jgi:dolichol-phosphate mannosyltransferase
MHRKEFAASEGGFAEAEPSRRPALSVVVPLYDEEPIVPVLAARLARVLDDLAVEAEVILVDDGSRDGTLAAIARAHAADPRFVGLSLSRNFGHQPAISAGLAHARGEAVVVMDGDLQDPPEAIGPLWAKLNEGHDVVYAIRARRPEGWPKRLAYHAYYRLLGRVVAFEIPLDAGDFGIMSRQVVERLNALPERRRFLRGLRAWVGFRQVGLPIARASRHAGRPKFTPSKLFALALDGLVGFSEAPTRPAAVLGLLGLFQAGLGLAASLARGLLGGVWAPGWCWVALAVWFSGGAQLLFVAILGEYVNRIFQEVSGRPPYLVCRRIGLVAPGRTPDRSRSRRRSRSRTWD